VLLVTYTTAESNRSYIIPSTSVLKVSRVPEFLAGTCGSVPSFLVHTFLALAILVNVVGHSRTVEDWFFLT